MRNLLHLVRYQIGLAAAETQTTDDERACIAVHARGSSLSVEVGVWHGVTTRIIRSVMAENGRLLAVDPFPIGRLGFSIHRLIAIQEVQKASVGVIEFVRTQGHIAANQLPTDFKGAEFVFIDGDHSYEGISKDWTAWSPLMAIGGRVCLHDSRSCPGRDIESWGSVTFTKEIILSDQHFAVIDEVDSLTVLRKIA